VLFLLDATKHWDTTTNGRIEGIAKWILIAL
jgi:hypothetical protein